MNDRSMLEQILQAWRVNNAINLKLAKAIPKKGFDAVPLASRGRTVAKQLAHMQKVHSGWLKYQGARFPRDAKPLHRNSKLDRKRLVSALRASGAAVEAFLREKLQSGERIKFFQGKPIRWLCYLIAHDSHHRGQIALALKQNGMRLPEKVAIREIWNPWFGRDF